VQFRERLWTYSLVTVVAVLIWYWAAAETRGQRPASFRLEFAPAADQVVSPRELNASVQMEGSRLALDRALRLASRGPLTMTAGNELPSEGVHQLDLVELLDRHDPLTDTGIRVLAADPATVDIRVDGLVPVSAAVKPDLAGVETQSESVVPEQVVVNMPGRLRERIGEDFTVIAHVPQSRLERLESGIVHKIENVKLRLPAGYAGERSVTIDPPTATVQLTIRSLIEESTLPTVRVQIAGPPEDHDEYIVEIEDRALSDVTIKGEGTLIQQVNRGQVRVVALVHLSAEDKERRVESKPVTCFMALHPDGRAVLVDAEINGSHQLPVIRLKITERVAASTP
jgi:hypothetical protein